jgi:hypothetical protein
MIAVAPQSGNAVRPAVCPAQAFFSLPSGLPILVNDEW